MLNAFVALTMNPPWSQTVAFARALLAFSTMIPLATADPSNLFLAAAPSDSVCATLPIINMYCVLEPSQYWVGSGVSLVVLALVIVGILPQITCWAHAYVAYCFATAVTVPVGGDQIAQNLTLILIPICMTWPAISMWKPVPPRRLPGWREVIGWSSLAVITVQAVVVYAVASISKLAVMEWADGTAVYYWLSDPTFGPAGLLGDALRSLTGVPLFLGIVTFGTLAIEAGLALAFLYGKRGKRIALALGVSFHGAIAVTMGLYSFSLAMIALLLLYLGDPSRIRIDGMPGCSRIRARLGGDRKDRLPQLAGEPRGEIGRSG